MNEREFEKLIEYLEQKWGSDPRCPMCGHHEWNVHGTSFELREFHEGNLVIGGGTVIPVVPVMCINCGNTVLVNAIHAGAEEAEPKNSTKEETA